MLECARCVTLCRSRSTARADRAPPPANPSRTPGLLRCAVGQLAMAHRARAWRVVRRRPPPLAAPSPGRLNGRPDQIADEDANKTDALPPSARGSSSSGRRCAPTGVRCRPPPGGDAIFHLRSGPANPRWRTSGRPTAWVRYLCSVCPMGRLRWAIHDGRSPLRFSVSI